MPIYYSRRLRQLRPPIRPGLPHEVRPLAHQPLQGLLDLHSSSNNDNNNIHNSNTRNTSNNSNNINNRPPSPQPAEATTCAPRP